MKNTILKTTVSLLSLLALTACPGGGGGGEITISNQPSASSGTYAVTISTVNGNDSTQWTADSNGVPYSTTVGVTLTGTCTRGVSKVNAYLNGSTTAESTQATCDALGNYSISVTLPTPNSSTEREGVVNTILLKPVLADGSEGAGTASRTVNVDIYGPTFGTISHSGSGSGPYSVSPSPGQEGNANFTVTAIVSADTVTSSGTVTSATNLNVSNSGTSLTATATLAAGFSDIMVLTIYDSAGNSTASSSITTTYVNSLNTIAFQAGTAAVGGGSASSTNPGVVGLVGGLGSVISGSHHVILGAPGVYTRYGN
jgi:hypothetical protein